MSGCTKKFNTTRRSLRSPCATNREGHDRLEHSILFKSAVLYKIHPNKSKNLAPKLPRVEANSVTNYYLSTKKPRAARHRTSHLASFRWTRGDELVIASSQAHINEIVHKRNPF